ncbi:MAG: hypothetical protein HYZ14_01950 [Bacteroidetes bacterium]|nr:hypothetical protein [Bacteroidota bacterium]
MNAFSDSHISLEFIGENIVHVCFKERALLSTQLLRELIAMSKIHKGKKPEAYILTFHELADSHHFLWKICHKSQLFEPETVVALVCPNLTTNVAAHSYIQNHNPSYPIAVFSKYGHGLEWVEQKLNFTKTAGPVSFQDGVIGMSA